ncbi:Plasmodium vivax Vir protein, putative [Plasmodium vivax]|uniref:Vir protein, putative n=1 Tax=Plasmodium vivax TaxID=5855 RepID=A0A1G4ECN5_PLAVI|nr:Plasmodium vivax Vir protein, putative [Plasmodium vivax]
MKYLYAFYKFYDEIKPSSYWDKENPCEKVSSNSFYYNGAIDEYYEKHRDFYDKISPVAKLIDEKINKDTKICGQDVYFRIPLKYLKAEEKKLQEKAEKLKQQQEAEKLKQQTRLPNNELQEVLHGHGEFHSSTYQAGSREFETSRLQRPTQKFEYSQRPESSTGLLWKNDLTQREPIPYTKEGTEYENEVIKEQDDKGTTRSGTFFGSSGIPSSITEVFGSVDPVPVVGVSGGMGALFLLFRYTPLGTFFRGGRGRAHRIPRSFNGQFLGAFPDVNEYNGGYIGYGPMDIPYGAE